MDDYRWLEDAASPEVVAWTEAQNRHTRSVLDALPGAEALRRRVREIRTIEVPRFGGLKAAGGPPLRVCASARRSSSRCWW